MREVLSDPRLYSYTGGQPPTAVDLHRRYSAQVAGSGRDDEVWVNWIVRMAGDGAPTGFVQATVTPSEAELAWVIGVAWQGQGLASEASVAMRRWLEERGVRRFKACIHPDHAASARVAERTGLARTDSIEDGEVVWIGTAAIG